VLAALFARVLAAIAAAITEASDIRRPQARLGRVVVVLALIALLCLLPLRLSPHSARVLGTVILAVVALSLLTTMAVFRRLLVRLSEGELLRVRMGRLHVDAPRLEREVRAFEGAMALVRRAGLAMPALLFFCVWAVVYMLIWAHSPAACPADPAHPCDGAFLGAGAHPTFGDFLYYSVNMAFANPAPDLIAHTRVAHTAATIEVLSGIGLVTLYAGAFFGLAAAQGAEAGAQAARESSGVAGASPPSGPPSGPITTPQPE